MMACQRWFIAVPLLVLVSRWPDARHASALRADEMVKLGVDTDGRIGKPGSLSFPRKTLVISDGSVALKNYSRFFQGLTGLGHNLTFSSIDSEHVTLRQYGEWSYNNVVLFAPRAASFFQDTYKGLTVSELVEFLDDEDNSGNLFVVGGSQLRDQTGQRAVQKFTTGEAVRDLALRCGIDFDAERSVVLDPYTQVNVTSAPQNVQRNSVWLYTKEMIDQPAIASPLPEDSPGLAYAGMGMLLDPSNEFVYPILNAGPTAYSVKRPLAGNEPMATGYDVVLVAAMQGLNSARAVFSGSTEMFSDETFQAHPQNEKFAIELAAWTFRQRGMIEWSDLSHHKVGQLKPPRMYTITDTVEFSVGLWEMTSNGLDWQPYTANDVQLEYTMLDPYIRIFLQPTTAGSKAIYSATFMTPDKPGIFKFVLKYKRRGYNLIHLETLAPLRNFKHNNFERFIWSATPYYSSCAAGVVALLSTVPFFLYHKDKDSASKKNA